MCENIFSSPSRSEWIRRRCFALLVVPTISTLIGCKTFTGPEYLRPEVETRDNWAAVSATHVSAQDAIQPQWWTGFNDSYLTSLVENSVAGNLDLRIAVARIDEAGAALGQVKASRLPTLSLGSSATYQGAHVPPTGDLDTATQYSNKAEIGWEIDIWGKTRKGVNAQKASYRASEADWRATYLTTVANVASTYFLIRQFDEQIQLQQSSLDTGNRILSIYRNQFAEGIVPKTQVLRQEAEVNRLQRSLLDLEREREISENALATLMGRPAGNLSIPQANLRGTVETIDIPAGLPSELLSRRPDIVAAEYRVLEAYELVGQAKLARLPSISLTGNTQGTGTTASDALTALVKSFSFGIGPSINIPIFDAKLKARVKINEASAKVREEEYRKTVILAFQEVENALVNLASRKAQKRELEAEVNNLEIVAQQTRAQLEAGIVTQLEVFESERRLLDASQTLLTNHQQILSETITLYKAMGGGWTDGVISQAKL